MAAAAYLEKAYDVADLADYEPPRQVGGEVFGKGDSVCSASRCGTIDEMRDAVDRAGVYGLALQGGGARRRRSRRRSRPTRRRQRGGRRKGRFTVNARIRIRLPRH